jgi:hypothetical protein
MMPLPEGRFLLAGGYDNGPATADTYDPATGLINAVVLNPRSFARPLDLDGDNVYHFTSVTIGAGTTVLLHPSMLGTRPVYWLASGPVRIDGTINLTGESGAPVGSSCANRRMAQGGPGGFPGGMAANTQSAEGGSGGSSAQAGQGPGGGGTGNQNNFRAGAGAGYLGRGANTNNSSNGGRAYGNPFIVPLQGGSGGAGGSVDPTLSDFCAGGGGGGGGALQIASSLSITVNGSIVADGGTGGGGSSPDANRIGWGGAGSGGAIYLSAPVLSGSGFLLARGATAPTSPSGQRGDGAHGRIRLEATQNTFTGTVTPSAVTGSPVEVVLPKKAPVVQVTRMRMDGTWIPVPLNPTGSFELPDVTVNGSELTLEIEAKNVPLNAEISVYVTSENGPDQVVSADPLQPVDPPPGGEPLSRTSAVVTFPRGFSRGFARAVWQ